MIKIDEIKVAGGAKSLASPHSESEREFILDQIQKSVRLHATKLVILMVHSDCGAYGGLTGGFQGDRTREAEHQQNELRTAARCVYDRLGGISVQAYFVDFEGVWEVELPAQPASGGQKLHDS
jgi:carbonic anhydrase